jgi:hypothetical protein
LPEGGERKQILSADKVLQILKNISDEDCRILGLDPEHAHPSWFILQVLPTRYSSPRHRMPLKSSNEGLSQVSALEKKDLKALI